MGSESDDITNLDTHLAERLRGEECSDVGKDGSIKPADDYPISLTEVTVGEDDVNCRSETLNDLDLENGALELGDVHETLAHALLRKVNEKLDHIRNTLARDGRRRDERDVATEVFVVVVEARVHTLLGEGEDSLLEAISKLALDLVRLLRERILEGAVRGRFPAVDAIDLVEGDDERRLLVAEEVEGFDRLRLETVHKVDDENGNVAK